MKNRGFTIVELLIVIVVIGGIALITVISYSGIQERARVASANSDIALLAKAVNLARVNTDKVLGAVTGNYCTDCGNQVTYETSLDKISAASGVNLSNLNKGDPWGVKYIIDENEGEGATPCAWRDTVGLRTVG